MCNAYNVKTDLAALAARADMQLDLSLIFPPGVTAQTSNLEIPSAVYPRRNGLVLRPADPARPEAGLEPMVAHWNLTPFFHKGDLKAWKASSNNCRSETMATSPAFREAYKRRRCIIPATSFTEWTGPTGRKTAHAITRADGGLLFMAGLWDRCTVEGAPMESYTMVMIPAGAGDDVGRFHNRQPVQLDRTTARLWLDLEADIAPVLRPPPPGTLAADPPEPVAA